jgi:hypothetical protein
MRLRKIMILGVVFLLVVLVPLLVLGNSKTHTIKNPSPVYTANDLHIVTEDGDQNKVNSARIRSGNFSPKSLDATDDHHVTWPPGSGSVPPTGSVEVAVNTKSGAELDDDNTGLTWNGTLLTADSCLCGCNTRGCYCGKLPDGSNRQHFDLGGGGGGGGGAHRLTISNDQPIDVVYTNVQVWLENANSIGQVDSLATFDIPTGFLSSMVPSTIEIPAHSDTTFGLEPYTSGYDLFLGEGYPICNSASISPLASAEVPSQESIPTLGAISLAALVLFMIALGVYMILRRKRVLSTA